MDKHAGRQRDVPCLQAMSDARKKRRNRPQPWIVRKFAVGLSIGLIGYVCYVYVDRLCVPMIVRKSGALGGRAMGVAFLVVFSLLLGMLIWAYGKVVLTSPGYAKDHIPQSEPPLFPLRPRQSWESDGTDIGTSYENMPTGPSRSPPSIREPPSAAKTVLQKLHSRTQSAGSSKPNTSSAHRRGSSLRSRPESKSTHRHTGSATTTLVQAVAGSSSPGPSAFPPAAHNPDPEAAGSGISELPSLYTRRPPTTPVLLPQYRYCTKDELVKPFRTHHCSACGTCVLKYDHHCPWVGQCVGARNQKFFVNFLQWSTPSCFWVFASTLAVNVSPSSNPGGSIDVQHIIVIVCAGLLGIFSAIMLSTHIHLILANRTTVESLQLRAMRDRERYVLGRLHPWYNCRARRMTRKKWDEEWGNLSTEGNIWWLGSEQNWRAVMGENPWWWFLPIGHSASDGLSYPPNPRFDEQGRWRRRTEWPVELR